jgi:hypothetical protein
MILTSSRKVMYKDKYTTDWHETDASDAAKLFHNEPQLYGVSSPSSSSSISPGVAAGVSVGLAVLVGTIVALAVFGYRRRKKKDTDELLSESVRRYHKDRGNLTTESVESI